MTCIWSKCVDTSFHIHSTQNSQQNNRMKFRLNPRRFSLFSKYANNRPRTGTSHIIGQNLWAKFGVTQRFANHFFVKGPEAPMFTGPGDNYETRCLGKQD